MLAHKPVSEITIAEIVEGCGMTAPTFYNHFSDKYALMHCSTNLMEVTDTMMTC